MKIILLFVLLGLVAAKVSVDELLDTYSSDFSNFPLLKCLNGSKADDTTISELHRQIRADETREFTVNLKSALRGTHLYVEKQKQLSFLLSSARQTSEFEKVIQDPLWPTDTLAEALNVLQLLHSIRDSANTPWSENIEELLYFAKHGVRLTSDKNIHVRSKRDYKDAMRNLGKWSCAFLKFLTQKMKFEKHIAKYIMIHIPPIYQSQALQILLTDGVYALSNFARSLCRQPKVDRSHLLSAGAVHNTFHNLVYDTSKECYKQMKQQAERNAAEMLEKLSDVQAEEIKTHTIRLIKELNTTIDAIDEAVENVKMRETLRLKLQRVVEVEKLILIAIHYW